MLAELREMGVHDVIRKAGSIIEERGLAKYMHCDPLSGNVDPEGAVMLACGAESIGVLVAYPAAVIPAAKMALFDAAMDYLNAASPNGDLAIWADQDDVTQPQVVEFFLSSASEIAGAIVY